MTSLLHPDSVIQHLSNSVILSGVSRGASSTGGAVEGPRPSQPHHDRPNLSATKLEAGCPAHAASSHGWDPRIPPRLRYPFRSHSNRSSSNSPSTTPSSPSPSNTSNAAFLTQNPIMRKPIILSLGTPGGLLSSTRKHRRRYRSLRRSRHRLHLAHRQPRRVRRLLSPRSGRHRRHGARHKRRSLTPGRRGRHSRPRHEREARERHRRLPALLRRPAADATSPRPKMQSATRSPTATPKRST